MKKIHYTLQQLDELPSQAGVYEFYDRATKLIYVGKAKNLRKRVGSYFSRGSEVALKTQKMVERIHSIACVLVNNEYEALLLENNLIKEKQPRYNVLLKDGKTYPYLLLTDERFPRLIATRQRTGAGKYFGPFTHTSQMEAIEELIRALYPLRTCRYHLSEKNIAQKKFRVCLEYHIGNCLGPCEGRQDEAAYGAYIAQVHHLLKGNFQHVKRELKAQAKALAAQEKYKEAHRYKQKLEAVEKYQAKSVIIQPRLGNLDVIVAKSGGDHAFVHYFYVQGGAIVFAQTTRVRRKLGETSAEILPRALHYFREVAQSQAHEVLTSQEFAPLPEGVALVLPQRGDKHKLLQLALKNLFFYQKNYLNEQVKKPRPGSSTLMRLQQDLGLQEVPMHIECFDNSHWQGGHPVGAMVCFKKGRPAKRHYRHFHIKTASPADDFAFMHEVVQRHYTRQIEQHEALPDLLLIDGGKGQLTAAMKALAALKCDKEIAIIGLAKRLELIFRPHDSEPLYIAKTSTSLRLLQQIRDEAHRFALAFHRKVRQKEVCQSELHAIPAIGARTIQRLLQTFKTVAGIRGASHDALAKTIGPSRAAKVQAYFQKKETQDDTETEQADP